MSEPLRVVLEDLEQQREQYSTERKRLEEAIQAFNQHGEAIDDIYTHLDTHYQSNCRLGDILPFNRQRVEKSIQLIREHLAQLDAELTYARTQHEISQKKRNYRF